MNKYPLYREIRKRNRLLVYKFVGPTECHMISQEWIAEQECTRYHISIIRKASYITFLLEYPLLQICSAGEFAVAYEDCWEALSAMQKTPLPGTRLDS
ncbi:MAG: hypothetical protein KF690_03450 [Bacteroidetes bacterium]|nr:hypothetical protein [Bacteroidota bacterium]